jgi:ribonuclease R
VKELLRVAGLHPGQQASLKRALRQLVKDGVLRKEGKRFSLPEARFPRRAAQRHEVLEGTLSVHRDGFGFVDDVFLPPHEVRKALEGDRVRVVKRPSGRGRFEGKVVEVVERRRERGVGVYRVEGDEAWVEPNDPTLPKIRVPTTQLARPGDAVKVRLGVGADLLRGDGLVGEVSGSLGRPGDPSQEVLSVVFAKGFSDEFPPAVMDAADAVPLAVDVEAALAEGRKDLRQLPLVTIDGADARDFDDAVYAEPSGHGGYRLWVAIADVAHYVRPGTPLDDEAQARGTSVYLPDRVLPMLPERLSNGICSLRPDEDRLCMVAELQIDAQGETKDTRLYPAVMRSAARCTYEEVQAVLEGQSVPHRDRFRSQFETLAGLARALNRMRAARGAIDFDLPENKVRVGEDGLPTSIERRTRLESHRLIEALMLAANEAVARFFHQRAVPTVYRFHAEPDPDKLATFLGLAEAYGFDLGEVEGVDSKALNAFMRQLQGHPEQRALNQLLLRSMMQAVYSAENAGHYGLAAEHYLHFTSPIRRYPDLIVHRLLKALWSGAERARQHHEAELEGLERLATHCSERERAAVQAEREVVAFYSALLMKERVGEEFEAAVASVTDFGAFAELHDPVVEGLVRLAGLGRAVRFDERRHALVLPSGRLLKVGQPLRVRIASVSLERRQIELEVVRLGEAAVRPEESQAAAGSRRSSRHGAEEETQASASPHPGFDRLRALAARAKGTRASPAPGAVGRRSAGKRRRPR